LLVSDWGVTLLSKSLTEARGILNLLFNFFTNGELVIWVVGEEATAAINDPFRESPAGLPGHAQQMEGNWGRGAALPLTPKHWSEEVSRGVLSFSGGGKGR